MNRTAIISECGVYRYELRRDWNPQKPRVAFVMLNPSTADAEKDDPTIRRCVGFAGRWGYGGLIVVNLFAFRATDPDNLKKAQRKGFDVVGSENDTCIKEAIAEADCVVAAWGIHGGPTLRALEVSRFLPESTIAITTTAKGYPSHPLMLAYDLKPERWAHRGLNQ